MQLEWKERRTAILRDYDVITKKILALNDFKGAKLKPLKEGYVNLALLATKGNIKRVIKISVDDALQSEVYWYAKAEKAGVNVSKLIYYDLSKEHILYKYCVMSYIDGKPPNSKSKELLYNAGFFAGKELRKLHKIHVNGFGLWDSNNKWTNKTWLETLWKYRHVAINEKAALNVLKPKQIALIDSLTIFNKELEFKGARLLHGDPYEENILYSRRLDRFFIIDPSPYIIAGDPIWDVSYSTVKRSVGFDAGVKDGYGLNVLTEKELYRLKMLSIFNIFYEMAWYVANTDSKREIKKLHKLLLNKLYSV